MTQKLYAIVSNETGRIMKKQGNSPRLGIFVAEGTARQHAWRYGAKEGNYTIVQYEPVKFGQKVVTEEWTKETAE